MSRVDLLPAAGPVLSLRQALYRAGRDYRGGITSLALDLGMDLDALQKKLKFDFDGRWPSPDELEEIISATQDTRLLDALVRPAGAVWFKPVPVAATRDALKAVGALLQNEGNFVSCLHAGGDDNIWRADEVAMLRLRGHAVIRQVLAIIAGAEQQMLEDGRHG